MVNLSLKAADMLASRGIQAEVIDLRTLKPLDEDTIINSVRKTGRAIVVDQGHLSFGVTAEIASIIADKAFNWLDNPVKRLGGMDIPIPYSPALDPLIIPSEKNIYDAALSFFSGDNDNGN